MRSYSSGYRCSRLVQRLATVPASIASGVRTAIDFVRNPSRGGLAVAGAIGFWAANIGILWASFHAFDVEVPLGVVVQGFFVGMVANLIPFVPGGVGAVDAGLIGTFVLFGLPGQRGLRRRPRLPADRLLAADPARDRGLLPAAAHGRALAGGAGARPSGATWPSRSRARSACAARPLLQKVKYDERSEPVTPADRLM